MANILAKVDKNESPARKFSLNYVWLIIAFALTGIDRLTKYLITSNMELKDKIPLIGFGDREVLNLYYVLNNGAAFSKLSGQTTLLIILTSAIILWLMILLIFKKVSRPAHLASIGLIIGGGLGNLIDRLFNNGQVVDFIDFSLINFPIFNFADMCAVCGAGLLLITVVTDEVREFRLKRSQKSSGTSDDIAKDHDDRSN